MAKTITGVVSSNKTDKTIVVTVREKKLTHCTENNTPRARRSWRMMKKPSKTWR